MQTDHCIGRLTCVPAFYLIKCHVQTFFTDWFYEVVHRVIAIAFQGEISVTCQENDFRSRGMFANVCRYLKSAATAKVNVQKNDVERILLEKCQRGVYIIS